MSEEQLSYDQLVFLANDPTLSNEEREDYRARLNLLFGARLRAGFSAASVQVKPASTRRGDDLSQERSAVAFLWSNSRRAPSTWVRLSAAQT